MPNFPKKGIFGAKAVAGEVAEHDLPKSVPSKDGNAVIIDRLWNDARNISLWRELFAGFLGAEDLSKLPDSLIGGFEVEVDPELCLLKGEGLCRLGREDAGIAFLRQAPRLSIKRSQAFDFSCRASQKDSHFINLIAQADNARNNGQWERARQLYEEALQLYPHHAGYLIQLAHCFKEQDKFLAAEITYRSALGYCVYEKVAVQHGVSMRDLLRHLNYVADRYAPCKALDEQELSVPNEDVEIYTPLAERPTRRDVILAYEIMLGYPPNDERVLETLRTHVSIEQVFLTIIDQLDFIKANRRFLLLYQQVAGGSHKGAGS